MGTSAESKFEREQVGCGRRKLVRARLGTLFLELRDSLARLTSIRPSYLLRSCYVEDPLT